jgi:pyruvate formate lyase activating enzyme
MKEALYYEVAGNGKVKCLLCPKGCVILADKYGVCGVRKNIDGKLFSMVYEKPIVIHIDPIEKKPLYHFHPGSEILSIGTYGCNLKCEFCQNFDISQMFRAEDLKKLETLTSAQVISICKKKNLEFVAFTYNEPTVFYEYMLDVAKLCEENGIRTVMVSNGQINEEPFKELIKYIDAFNIDLKSFNENFYTKICKGNIETTKRTLEIICENKKHLEITFLLIEGFNDNEDEFIQMCEYVKKLGKDIVFHISRAFPRYKMEFNITPISLLEKFAKIAKSEIKYVYVGNV